MKQILADIPAAILTAYAMVVTALVTAFNAVDGFISRRLLKRSVREVKEVVVDTKEIAVDTKGTVSKVAEHTDGMLKTMTDSAHKAGQKAGAEQATVVAEIKADALAQGQAEGRAEKNEPKE